MHWKLWENEFMHIQLTVNIFRLYPEWFEELMIEMIYYDKTDGEIKINLFFFLFNWKMLHSK